jgi:Derlin-2/3
MDQVMGGEGGFPLETWFWEMPIVTRWWTTATLLTSGLVQCKLVTPFQLFYSYRTVFHKSQVCHAAAPTPPQLTGCIPRLTC